MRMHVIFVLAASVMLATYGRSSGANGFLTVKDGRFVDAAGRHVILHGINVGGKHKNTNYVSWHRSNDFARMRQWGFNCVRLLIIWAAIEPEPGHYDEAYLRRIDERITWAKSNGLYVLLDMHQDLWGEKPGGDGAPAWATLDDGRPHKHVGQVWSDAYLTSPMIQTAFDSFWENKPGPDGVGIQERFALAWQHVAKRYAGEPTVIGYDLFNEPFCGSPILLAQMLMVRHLVKLLDSQDTPKGTGKLIDMLGDPEVYQKIYRKFDNVDTYRQFLASCESILKMFERNRLAAMYNRVAKAIRQVDIRHILFLEPSISANRGFASDLQPVLGLDGKPDPLQAFAPHAYDIVTETAGAGPASEERMGFILDRLGKLARRLDVPMLLGEWGAFQGEAHANSIARLYVRKLEQGLASDTYWYFSKRIEKTAQFEMLQRPYPSAVAGTLMRYRFDPETKRFECRWKEDPAITQPTEVYLPQNWYPGGCKVLLEPVGKKYRAKSIRPGAKNRLLRIPPTGKAVERQLTIQPKP